MGDRKRRFYQPTAAHCFAGMRAYPANATGQGVILFDDADCLRKLAGSNQTDITLAIVMRWAAVAAGRTAVA